MQKAEPPPVITADASAAAFAAAELRCTDFAVVVDAFGPTPLGFPFASLVVGWG